jgi:hypothetical protein
VPHWLWQPVKYQQPGQSLPRPTHPQQERCLAQPWFPEPQLLTRPALWLRPEPWLRPEQAEPPATRRDQPVTLLD